jgi:hypothetical protein
MSFEIYDMCGDSEAGRIFRRAILEKMNRCPYSPQAKAKFQAWRIDELEGMLSTLVKRGSLDVPKTLLGITGGTNPDGSAKICREYRETPNYIERRTNLLRYSRHEITVDQAIGSDCPSGSAPL